jgi:hypothetical protein
VTLKVMVLTESVNIGQNYHATCVTEMNRIARVILPQESLKKDCFYKLMKVRLSSGVDIDFIRSDIETKVSFLHDI